ncbi:hypothetical protein PTI98_004230 [Pleurotus ostreatus]|nr:hypothetical protein PTI98_004230 [Pleurotus ostreatus]
MYLRLVLSAGYDAGLHPYDIFAHSRSLEGSRTSINGRGSGWDHDNNHWEFQRTSSETFEIAVCYPSDHPSSLRHQSTHMVAIASVAGGRVDIEVLEPIPTSGTLEMISMILSPVMRSRL